MADIFREIDEELQQEKAARLWKRYGPYVLAVAVLIVLGVGGYRFWLSYDAKQKAAQSARYETAARALAEDPAAAAAEFGALAQDGNKGYAALASLQQAAALVEAGDLEAAIITYKKLADDTAVPAVFRDLARLLAVTHRIDSGDPTELSREISALANTSGPWRPLAREAEALIALKAGDKSKAREILETLTADAETPAQLRARATELLSAIASE
ncbi:tetratricopeptide repeat protein [Nisaea acidiphila]|uniref:Tetratricopeptide repeat protein n=1 Tax=Nisaea acidiphila TaxID=1862145 RepID=A0A9J7AQ53_9PROT|nr:tetratricopeptide repeat protein [Nisaea acidiphila]UUX49359.1 tetratricopeptide repeat protein [Nisaea acidiphila]